VTGEAVDSSRISYFLLSILNTGRLLYLHQKPARRGFLQAIGCPYESSRNGGDEDEAYSDPGSRRVFSKQRKRRINSRR
jgi:hypothetical protein